MRKHLALAALAATLFASSASSESMKYADERCADQIANNVRCVASTEVKTMAELVGYSMPFAEFLAVNSLPADTSPDTPVQPWTFYIVRIVGA